MNYEINETHDPNLKSWIESANAPDTDFPIQNLPFCVFSENKSDEFKLGVAIGDYILDLDWLREDVLEGDYWISFDGKISDIRQDRLSRLRYELTTLLSDKYPKEKRSYVEDALILRSEVSFVPPFQIGDYTDFYCSIFHATNVGAMFRPDNPLLPNYKYIPIGYHGRASSIVISGTDVKRPNGQNRSDAEKPPVFMPAKNLDYEMEVGFFVGQGNELGTSIPIADAEKHKIGRAHV